MYCNRLLTICEISGNKGSFRTGMAIGLFLATTLQIAPAVAQEVVFRKYKDRVLLPAPITADRNYLGAALTAELGAIDDQGRPLGRAYEGSVTSKSVDQTQIQWTEISTTAELNLYAQTSWFAKISGELTSRRDFRFLIYHAYHISRVDEFGISPGTKPTGRGALTPLEVRYGWSVSVIFYGERERFTGSVRAEIVAASAGLSGRLDSGTIRFTIDYRGGAFTNSRKVSRWEVR